MKRYASWYFGGRKFALRRTDARLPHVIFTHRTPLLRRLKDVDMWLQHNKVKNLQIAKRRLNGLILRPGETFSYWRLKRFHRERVSFYADFHEKKTDPQAGNKRCLIKPKPISDFLLLTTGSFTSCVNEPSLAAPLILYR